MIKLILVLPHDSQSKSLITILEAEANIQIIGAFRSGQQAINDIVKYKPDVVVIDADAYLYEENFVLAIKKINRRVPGSHIIALNQSEKDKNLIATISAGARGYISKKAAPEELVLSINIVAKGHFLISNPVSENLRNIFIRLNNKDKVNSNHGNSLTKREVQVLRFVAQGDSNRYIANTLSVSENTIKVHMKNIVKKLGVNNRQQAAIRATKEGII